MPPLHRTLPKNQPLKLESVEESLLSFFIVFCVVCATILLPWFIPRPFKALDLQRLGADGMIFYPKLNTSEFLSGSPAAWDSY